MFLVHFSYLKNYIQEYEPKIMIDKTFLVKFLKFGIVGGSGVFVDFGVTWLLKDIFRVKKYIANSIGFIIAASTNYILNRIWTFCSNNPDVFTEYLSFFIFFLIGLGLNNLVIFILTDLKYQVNFYVAKIFATATVFIWNFLMNYFITFA